MCPYILCVCVHIYYICVCVHTHYIYVCPYILYVYVCVCMCARVFVHFHILSLLFNGISCQSRSRQIHYWAQSMSDWMPFLFNRGSAPPVPLRQLSPKSWLSLLWEEPRWVSPPRAAPSENRPVRLWPLVQGGRGYQNKNCSIICLVSLLLGCLYGDYHMLGIPIL